MPRTKWLAALLLAPVTLFALACGGGDSEEKAVTKKANDVLLTYLDVLAGHKDANALIDVYAPECRSGVDPDEIDEVLSIIPLFAPEFAKIKIQEVDLGKLKIEKDGDTFKVTPVDPNAIRVKVDGKFQNADDYFKSLGGQASSPDGALSTTSITSMAGESTLSLVRQGDKLYVSTCDELQNFTDF